MRDKFTKWEEFEKELDITPEQEAEIQLEMDLIKATIEARKKSNLSQRELSKKAGIMQPVIARIESLKRSPQASTLIKMLYPMGYTIRVVPLEENKINALYDSGKAEYEVNEINNKEKKRE